MLLPFAALAMSFGAASAHPKSELVISPCNTGEHYQFESVSCSFELKNTGPTPIKISKGEAKIAGDSIDSSTIVVAPHSVSYIKAQANLLDAIGVNQRTFVFATDEAGQARRGSTMVSFVTSVLDQRAPSLEFGDVDVSEPALEKSITLSSREVADFRINEVLSKPDYLDVAIVDNGRTIRATLRPNAPWGQIEGAKIKLKINAPQQDQVWVAIAANIKGAVVADASPYSLGLMRTNLNNEFLIRITSRAGKNFKVGPIDVVGIKASAKPVACIPAKDGCQLIKLVVANDQAEGQLKGSLEVGLPDFGRSLPIQLVGMLLSPSVKIHDFNSEIEKNSSFAGPGKSNLESVAPKHVDVGQSIRQTVNEKSAVEPAGDGPLLRWSVANQGSVHGYLIYRSSVENGPMLRINKETVQVVSDDSGTAGSYAWRDNSAESGKTYWYAVEMLKNNGEKVALTGVQKVTAK